MKSPRLERAFTLTELLVVIAIIALLTAVGMPALRGMASSNQVSDASRQLLDDLRLARSRAIAERTTVYMVFVPTNFTGLAQSIPASPTPADQALATRNAVLIQRLLSRKYIGYALFAERRVGDQPGRASMTYVTAWRTLPEGTFIAPEEFDMYADGATWAAVPSADRPLPYDYFPFPSDTDDCDEFPLPYVAFNYLGQLVQPRYLNLPLGTQFNETIHVAEGSIFYPRGAGGNLINEFAGDPFEPADIIETPPGNSSALWVEVQWLTGRAELAQPEIID